MSMNAQSLVKLQTQSFLLFNIHCDMVRMNVRIAFDLCKENPVLSPEQREEVFSLLTHVNHHYQEMNKLLISDELIREKTDTPEILSRMDLIIERLKGK